MLASSGEIGEPCGVPASICETTPPSNTPARSQPRSSLTIRRSTTRRCTWAISASWSMASKHAWMSVSSTHTDPGWPPPGRLPGPADRTEVGLEDRIEHDLCHRHQHPITHRGNAERPGLPRPARLGNVHPPQRLRTVPARPHPFGEPVEKGPHRLHAPGLDSGDPHPVDPRSAAVGGHGAPRSPHHVAAGALVPQRVEPTFPVVLGTAVKHALQGTHGIQAIDLSNGPSRHRGTHQRPSPPRRTSVKQGPFAHAGLCCPRRSIATTTPSVSLSAGRHFPGPPVIGGPAPDPRRIGAEEGLSSSRDTLLTVPRPLRRRVLRRPLQVPKRLPWPSPDPHRLGTLCSPPTGGSLNDAADFATRCGPISCSTPLRPQPLNRTRRLRYRGPWRLPGPDFHRLATASLSPGYVMTTPSKSWRPGCWTHVD